MGGVLYQWGTGMPVCPCSVKVKVNEKWASEPVLYIEPACWLPTHFPRCFSRVVATFFSRRLFQKHDRLGTVFAVVFVYLRSVQFCRSMEWVICPFPKVDFRTPSSPYSYAPAPWVAFRCQVRERMEVSMSPESCYARYYQNVIFACSVVFSASNQVWFRQLVGHLWGVESVDMWLRQWASYNW